MVTRIMVTRGSDFEVTSEYIQGVRDKYSSTTFQIPKYIQFIETSMNLGLKVSLYLPKSEKSVSKYVTVSRRGKRFKVRFSNHAPIKQLELNGSCDFFVGKTNLTVTTTQDAIEAMKKFFKIKEE